MGTGAATSYSSRARFVLVNTTLQPLIPQLSSPYGVKAIYTLNSNLNWWVNGASTDSTFEPDINQNNSFSESPKVVGVTGQSHSLTLLPGAIYYWKVKSIVASQTSGWSTSGTFVTLPVSTPFKPVASWPLVYFTTQ